MFALRLGDWVGDWARAQEEEVAEWCELGGTVGTRIMVRGRGTPVRGEQVSHSLFARLSDVIKSLAGGGAKLGQRLEWLALQLGEHRWLEWVCNLSSYCFAALGAQATPASEPSGLFSDCRSWWEERRYSSWEADWGSGHLTVTGVLPGHL